MRPAILLGIAVIAIVALVIAIGFSTRPAPTPVSPTITAAPAKPAAPVTPPQRNTSCRDALCDTEWGYSDSTSNPKKILGFSPDPIVVFGGSKGIYSLDGNKVYMEMNNKYAEYRGTLNGNQIRGYTSNVDKFNWTWSATKR
jgi:hypothetical protein